jgi:hypothetical protein
VSNVLFGETLVWVTCDTARVFSAGLHSMLTAAAPTGPAFRLEVVQAGSLEQASVLVEQTRAGLLTLVLAAGDEAAAYRTLRRVQIRRPDCVRCVYYPELLKLDELRLRETGAQMLAQQIPWYQQRVPQILARAPRRTGGNHPLTVGLVDRLPNFASPPAKS